jgi:hypothetical protein
LWDRRWIVSASPTIGTNDLFSIQALGIQTHALIDRLAPELRRLIPQGRVRAALPGIWKDQSLVAIPSFHQNADFRMAYIKQPFPSAIKML